MRTTLYLNHRSRLTGISAIASALLLCAFAATGARAIPPSHLAFSIRGTVSDRPADWVTAGPSSIAYGEGTRVILAEDQTPYRVLAAAQTSSPVYDGLMAGRTLLLAERDGIQEFDIADITHPIDRGLLPGLPGASHLAVLGDYLIVASDGEGLAVYEAGMHLSKLGSGAPPVSYLPLSESVAGMALSGTKVLLSLKGAGIATVDLSIPATPFLTFVDGSHPDAGPLAFPQDDVLVVREGASLRAFDFTSPTSEPIVSFSLAANALFGAGRAIYAATDEGVALLTAGGPQAASHTVQVGNVYFSPASLTIQQGDDVKWVWIGGTHSSTSGSCTGGGYGTCNPDGKWDSGLMSSGSFDHVFSSVETDPYFCMVHLSAMTGKITVIAASNLSATATASPTSGPAPLTVNLGVQASGGTPPYAYSWNFGDRTTSTSQSPQHAYTAAGTYNPTVTVSDSASATATASAPTITVTSSGGLTATTSDTPATGQAPLPVTFSVQASGGVSPYTYAWDFGDGAASTSQNPQHTYAAAGTYHPKVTVTDSAGATATATAPDVVVTSSGGQTPAILSVRKAGSPIRLVVMGSNFVTGAAVKINGTPAPKTTFKSATKMVAGKGAALKAMVPVGTAVQVTVTNPDGQTSAPFSFAR